MTDEERKEHKKQYSKERYDWLKEHHICTKCGSDDAIERSNFCPECSYKHWLYNIEYRKNTPAETKKIQNEESRLRHKKLREERRAAGLCWQCGNKIEQSNKTRCNKCLAKAQEKNRQKTLRRGKLLRSMRDGIEICTMCGNAKPLKDKKICQSCFDACIGNLAKTPTHNGKRVDNYFSQTMSSFFNQK